MAKPANSERIYSDKLPMALKPVGCSYTGAEWKQYIRLFPANGWGIADEKDTRDNGKISDVVKQIAEKHPKQIKAKKCLLIGADRHTEQRSILLYRETQLKAFVLY